MQVTDTTDRMLAAFASGRFSLSDWETYMDGSLPDAKALCLADMREVLAAGYSWEEDFLPVLNGVLTQEGKREEAVSVFHKQTDRLDEAIKARFGRTIDAELVLYLGLCNGAGWVTQIRDRATVLFGIEKILELNWQGEREMTGLILHELGHVYQAQYGVLHRQLDALPDQFLWQLFTEGIAMVFEQELVGEPEAFHQYDEAWKAWCDAHAAHLRQSFYADLRTMTHEDQRYFGDWVSFEGHGDTGYYLGTRFVRFLLLTDPFDRLIRYDLDEVRTGYERFLSLEP